MNRNKIENILRQHEPIRKAVMDLEGFVDSCNEYSLIQMHKAKSELDFLDKNGLIGTDDFILLNDRLKDLGNKFRDCTCKPLR